MFFFHVYLSLNSSLTATRPFQVIPLISRPTLLHCECLFMVTLLLVTYCSEVSPHAAYGCVAAQVTAPDVHEFQIRPRSKLVIRGPLPSCYWKLSVGRRRAVSTVKTLPYSWPETYAFRKQYDLSKVHNYNPELQLISAPTHGKRLFEVRRRAVSFFFNLVK